MLFPSILTILIQKCMKFEEKSGFFQNPFEIIHGLIHGFIRIYPKWIYPSSQPCYSITKLAHQPITQTTLTAKQTEQGGGEKMIDFAAKRRR